MKSKLDLAHDYAMKHTANTDSALDTIEKLVNFAWNYADAMYDELEKREKSEQAEKRSKFRELLNSDNTFIEREGQHFDDIADIQKTYSSHEDWHPDWDQAPHWAKWWAMDKDGDSYFYSYKPYISNDRSYWSDADFIYLDGKADLFKSHGYTGDWKESLRERPND